VSSSQLDLIMLALFFSEMVGVDFRCIKASSKFWRADGFISDSEVWCGGWALNPRKPALQDFFSVSEFGDLKFSSHNRLVVVVLPL